MTTSSWDAICAEKPLNHGLIGLDFPQFPYLSGYGMMIRSLRLNGFGRKDLFAIFGMRAMQGLDLLSACHRPGSPRRRLEVAVGLQKCAIPTYWSEEIWCPIDVGNRWNELHLAPRHCRECLRYGYHCALFQMPFVDHCPWHRTKLQNTCSQCARLYQGVLPRDGSATRCVCGNDPFDLKTATINMRSFPASSAAYYLEQYLTWCERERLNRYLVAPRTSDNWYCALSRLIAVPDTIWGSIDIPSRLPGRLHRWDSSSSGDHKTQQGDFSPWITLATSSSSNIAPLPCVLHRPLIKITKTVVSRFPVNTRLDLEKDGTRMERRVLVKDLIAARPHHFILPLGETPGENTWLNLSTVLPESLDLCACLIDAVDQHVTGPTVATAQRSGEAEKSVKFDQLIGRAVLQRALFHILLRGFAIGLTITMKKLSHLLQASQRPGDKIPVAELSCLDGRLVSISVTWVNSKG